MTNLYLRQYIQQKEKKIKQNWKRAENFEIYFCVSFHRYRQKMIPGGKTGHCVAAQFLDVPIIS